MTKADSAKVFQADIKTQSPFYPQSTGDWAEDNRLGREAAINLTLYVQKTGDMPTVAQVLREIYSDTSLRTSGIRAGFSCGIAGIMSKFPG